MNHENTWHAATKKFSCKFGRSRLTPSQAANQVAAHFGEERENVSAAGKKSFSDGYKTGDTHFPCLRAFLLEYTFFKTLGILCTSMTRCLGERGTQNEGPKWGGGGQAERGPILRCRCTVITGCLSNCRDQQSTATDWKYLQRHPHGLSLLLAIILMAACRLQW